MALNTLRAHFRGALSEVSSESLQCNLALSVDNTHPIIEPIQFSKNPPRPAALSYLHAAPPILPSILLAAVDRRRQVEHLARDAVGLLHQPQYVPRHGRKEAFEVDEQDPQLPHS